MTQVHFSMTLAIFRFITTDLSGKIPFFSMSSWGNPCSMQVFVDVMVEGGLGHNVMRGHCVVLHSPGLLYMPCAHEEVGQLWDLYATSCHPVALHPHPCTSCFTCRVLMKWNDCGIFIPHHVTMMRHCMPLVHHALHIMC